MTPFLRLAYGLAALAFLFVTLSAQPALADERGPDDVTIYRGTLLDRVSGRHPAGAAFVSTDPAAASKLFVPLGRATSPRLLWRHDLTQLRVYGRTTVVRLRIAGEWYAFAANGRALEEYDLEALGAIDDLERIEVTQDPDAHAAGRRVQRARAPRIRLDLRFYWSGSGSKPGSGSAAKPPAGGSKGSAGPAPGSKMKMLDGKWTIIHPKQKGAYIPKTSKMKMLDGKWTVIHPKQKGTYIPKASKMKMQDGKWTIIRPQQKGTYIPKASKMKMLDGKYRVIRPMQQGTYIPQAPKAQMMQGTYKQVTPTKAKHKVARAAPMGYEHARRLIRR